VKLKIPKVNPNLFLTQKRKASYLFDWKGRINRIVVIG
jgi:hypothetical protein